MAAALSVIVPTRDRPEQLDACLTALRATLRPDDELIVVDSASRQAAVAAVAGRHGARLVRCGRRGVSRARNAGAAAATHSLLAFVDDDVRVAAGWAAAMAAALGEDTVAFVTGRVAVPPAQEGYQRPVAIVGEDIEGPCDHGPPGCPGNSANLGVRREALAGIGGFDEAMGGGARFEAAEDLDLFDRLLAAGGRGRYEPSVQAWHDQWRTRRDLLWLDWRYGIGAGARLAKLVRSDRGRARAVAVEVTWRGDVRTLARMSRARQEFAVLLTVLRLLGTVVGFLHGLLTPLRDGRYRVSR